MKINSKIMISVIGTIVAMSGLYLYVSNPLSPQELIKKQLYASTLSPRSVWDQQFLDQNPLIMDKIVKFERGTLCNSLKKLNTKMLTHAQIKTQLNDLNYECVMRPMTVNPKASQLTYLKVDNTTTQNPGEQGVAMQEICYEKTRPECVIRIKRDGFPLNRRSNPHSTKAVLLDAQGDPGSYDNEAFKVGVGGQPIPKGPSVTFGLKKCPYEGDEDLCRQWVDLIMDEAHPVLREPVGAHDLNP
jgi:hypothetical protein